MGISLWMRADTDFDKNGDFYDCLLVVIFSLIIIVYPIACLIFLYKKHNSFYNAYIRDKSINEQTLGHLINNKYASSFIEKGEPINE